MLEGAKSQFPLDQLWGADVVTHSLWVSSCLLRWGNCCHFPETGAAKSHYPWRRGRIEDACNWQRPRLGWLCFAKMHIFIMLQFIPKIPYFVKFFLASINSPRAASVCTLPCRGWFGKVRGRRELITDPGMCPIRLLYLLLLLPESSFAQMCVCPAPCFSCPS